MTNERLTKEDKARMEKVNTCVENGSLVIGSGIVIGTILSAVLLNPTPIYIGFTVGSAIALEECIRNKDRQTKPLPTKPSPPRKKEHECGSPIFDRFRKAPANRECKDRPCWNPHDGKDLKRTSNTTGLDATEFSNIDFDNIDLDDTEFDDTDSEIIDEVNTPLKRFKNPLRPEDTITPEDALKETFKSVPLKRFQKVKIIVAKEPTEQNNYENIRTFTSSFDD